MQDPDFGGSFRRQGFRLETAKHRAFLERFVVSHVLALLLVVQPVTGPVTKRFCRLLSLTI